MSELTTLFDFIEASPAAPLAADTAVRRLEACGYRRLTLDGKSAPLPGEKYYIRRGCSAVVAFETPVEAPTGLMMVAAHGDSPSFAVTPAGTMTVGDYLRLTVEKYGGMLCATWLDRPLSVAGVVCVREGEGKLGMRSVVIDRDLVVIPSVAIHMNRNANENASYNPATDMQPLFGMTESKKTVDELLAEELQIDVGNIVSRQLWLYVRQKPVVYGAEREFIGSPRLDDLECVSASLEAFVRHVPTSAMPVFVLFDLEEVGSASREGADSDLLITLVDMVCEAYAMNATARAGMLERSMVVSADNAHAKHPNHPEYADPNHAPKLNGGVVLKHNANRRYATDALTDALFSEICAQAGVPLQDYTNRPDLPGGSTLGCISLTHLSVPCVDIGLAQLAMHSAFETAGVKDYAYMVRALTAFYSTVIDRSGEDRYTWETLV